MSDRHEFFVEFGEDYARLQVACPYDRADAARPCWPHHEDGNGEFTIRDDPPQPTCTYEQNIENLDVDEMVHGSRLLPLGPVHVEWTDGYMTLHLRTVP